MILRKGLPKSVQSVSTLIASSRFLQPLDTTISTRIVVTLRAIARRGMVFKPFFSRGKVKGSKTNTMYEIVAVLVQMLKLF